MEFLFFFQPLNVWYAVSANFRAGLSAYTASPKKIGGHVFTIVKCLGWYVTAKTKACAFWNSKCPTISYKWYNMFLLRGHHWIFWGDKFLYTSTCRYMYMHLEQLWHKHLHKHQKGKRYEGDLLIDAWSKHIDDIPCPVKGYWISWLAMLSIHTMKLFARIIWDFCLIHCRYCLKYEIYQWIYAYYI